MVVTQSVIVRMSADFGADHSDEPLVKRVTRFQSCDLKRDVAPARQATPGNSRAKSYLVGDLPKGIGDRDELEAAPDTRLTPPQTQCP